MCYNYKVSDFEDLKNYGFKRTYKKIEDALYYLFYKDYETCCAKIRLAMESSVKDIYKILKKRYDPLQTYENRINNLKRLIPLQFEPDKPCNNLHKIRKISNLYCHDTRRHKDSHKDFLTCYDAMMGIKDWVLPFSNEYPIYKKEEEERKRERRRRRKQRNKRIAAIIASTVAVIGGIWGVKKWKKKK